MTFTTPSQSTVLLRCFTPTWGLTTVTNGSPTPAVWMLWCSKTGSVTTTLSIRRSASYPWQDTTKYKNFVLNKRRLRSLPHTGQANRGQRFCSPCSQIGRYPCQRLMMIYGLLTEPGLVSLLGGFLQQTSVNVGIAAEGSRSILVVLASLNHRFS